MQVNTIRKVRLAALIPLLASAAIAQKQWVVTWGASPAPQLAGEAEMRGAGLEFENQTLREIVHTSIGSGTVRVRLSNAYGKTTVEIGGAHLARRSQEADIVGGTDRKLTFGGRDGIAIPPDAEVVSDPVKLEVPAGSDLAISLYLPKATAGAGIHYGAQQTSYVGPGDATGAEAIGGAAKISSWVFLAAVDAQEPAMAATVVAFGDSITDGANSTSDANHRWPDTLAGRLGAAGMKFGVLNAGIGGNRVLNDPAANIRFGVNALARFDRDVLAQPGVKFAIVMEGINDLGHAGSSAPAAEAVSAEDIIGGLKQLIERAHEKGIRIFGATLTPFEGTVFPGYFTPEKETRREAINEWIRHGKAFDGLVDFDKAVRDPQHPDRILPAYDSGDHLHPGDAGYKAMGEAIDLKLFR
jgi:lysophospholipase L1-like esterase